MSVSVSSFLSIMQGFSMGGRRKLKFGGCLRGVKRVDGRCLEVVWEVSGRCLEGVWKVCPCVNVCVCRNMREEISFVSKVNKPPPGARISKGPVGPLKF